MSADTDRDQLYSEILFTRQIQPLIEEYLDVKIKDNEGNSDPISVVLDQKGGIDYLIETKSDVFGLSSRVQYDLKNDPIKKTYHTFTVRGIRDTGYCSELYKRSLGRLKGKLLPHLVCQAYFKTIPYGFTTVEEFDTIPLLRFAIARDAEVIEIAASNYAETKHTHADKVGSAEFKVVRWDDVISFRCPLLKYSPDAGFVGYVNGHTASQKQVKDVLFDKTIRSLKLLNKINRVDRPLSDYGVSP